MGARQSRRSVDITTTPKKNEIESPIEGEGKVEKIPDLETKITTNGSIHNEIEYADKDENEKDDEALKENGVSNSEESKTLETDVPLDEQMNEPTGVAEKSGESLEKSEEVCENNKKNKDKSKKKKWSFRSISFSRKDKSKPSKESEKNGDVKEVNEEGTEDSTSPISPEAGKIETSLPITPAANDAELPLANGNATSETNETLPDEDKNSTKVTEPKSEEKTGENCKVEQTLQKSEDPVPHDEQLGDTKLETPYQIVEEPKAVEPTSKMEEKDFLVGPKAEEAKEEPKTDMCKLEELKEEKTKIEESGELKFKNQLTDTTVEKFKEVRNEEVAPPLPSSNPPSPVMVFAESTMANIQVPLITEQSDLSAQATLEPLLGSTSKSILSTEILPPLIPEKSGAQCTSAKVDSDAASFVEKIADSIKDVSELVVESTIDEKSLLTIAEPLVDINSVSPVDSFLSETSVSLNLCSGKINQLVSSLDRSDLNSETSTTLEPFINGHIEISSTADACMKLSVEANSSLLEPSLNLPFSVVTDDALGGQEPTLIHPTSPIKGSETSPEHYVLPLDSVSNSVEHVINADSLPDISTESLPSLPEPLSESLPEAMSLPPVDCVPEPIALEVISSGLLPEPESLPEEPTPNSPLEFEKIQESTADTPIVPSGAVLTNGDAHGPPSPIVDESMLSSQEGPSKQAVSIIETSTTECAAEERHEAGDKTETTDATPVVAAVTEE
ncbi:hypothetical protein FQA39_LY16206 [Lamprigera yunnana]|nr:hypothetical protein FQA39_LY16206 [Lamprigera yunnana]